jgi:hypothetical protein
MKIRWAQKMRQKFQFGFEDEIEVLLFGPE